MREKRIRQELAALGYEPFEPTDLQRDMVEMYVLNGLSEDRIAAALGISITELRYHFHREMNYSRDQLLAQAAGRMVALANQTSDLGVAFRANQLMLQANVKSWRVPSADAPDREDKPVERMTLAEVEEELARLDAIRSEAVRPSEQEEEPAARQD